MKKTSLRKIAFRNIRGSLNRFCSIVLIVALGAGFLAGLLSATPDMYETADSYMDRYAWYDLDIKSTLGLTEEDVNAVAALSHVSSLQAARVYDMVLHSGTQKEYTARIFATLDEKGETALNQFELLEGRLPTAANECVIQQTMGRYASAALQLGDTLTMAEDDASSGDWDSCAAQTLTIVGICRSPMSISVEADSTTAGSGDITLLVYAPETLFDSTLYTDLYLKLNGLEALNTFEDSYEEKLNLLLPDLEALALERGKLRAKEVRAEAQAQMDEAESMLSLLEEVEGELAALESDRALREQQTGEVAALLEDAGASELSSMLRSMLCASVADDALSTEFGAQSALSDASDVVLLSESTTDASIPLAEELRTQLADAEALLSEIDDDNWLIRTREASAGYSSYAANVKKVAALCKIFPVFFFLVALLVSLTTMTRLIEENRAQVGTLKSLGVPDKSIWADYLRYALSASVLGCILGFVIGFRLFPYAIAGGYSMMYTLPETQTPFRLNIALGVAPITIGGILLATLWACCKVLKQKPAALLLPPAPRSGKRILLERFTPLWKHLRFSAKVTCRNLFRYKKRLFMTLIGLAGCSALLLTGFGLRDSINDIVRLQFGELNRYDLILMLKEDAAELSETEGGRELQAFLEANTASSLGFSSQTGRLRFGREEQELTVTIPEAPDEMSSYILLRNRSSHAALSLDASGVILTEKLCEQMGIQVGDTVQLENEDGRKASFTVSGITENYLTSYAYLSPEAYEAAYGKAPGFQQLLCLAGEGAPQDLAAQAMKCDAVLYARSTLSVQDTFSGSIKSIDAVILVLILSAGVLSMVVLYNLTNVNICERKKELATISVLGFTPREVQQYIFRETNLLSLLGSLCGLGLGVWLHRFVVQTIEVESVMFGRSIAPLSYLYALGLSLVFTLLVNMLMKKQIRQINMADAMKAND